MSEGLKAKLQEWSELTGRSEEELRGKYDELRAEFKKRIPNKSDKWYSDTARHRLYLTIKSELRSPAKPYDMISLGCGGAFDLTAGDRAEKEADWNNPETREQAVAEGRVYRHDPDSGLPRMTIKGPQGQQILVADGTPLDTRQWMTPPNQETGEKGRKNPNYGKPIQPTLMRAILGFGRPAQGGELKFIAISAYGDRTKLIPPRYKSVRTRLNLREDRPYVYVCNASTATRFQPIEMIEYPEVDEGVICEILRTAPVELKPSLADLDEWHAEHEEDGRRIVIVEGDVISKTDEPTQYGSYRVTIEDASEEDLEAPGRNIWLSEEWADLLKTFGRNSRVIAIGRTNLGPTFNAEEGRFDREIEAAQVNASGFVVDPVFRVAPEEETVIVAEDVK